MTSKEGPDFENQRIITDLIKLLATGVDGAPRIKSSSEECVKIIDAKLK